MKKLKMNLRLALPTLPRKKKRSYLKHLSTKQEERRKVTQTSFGKLIAESNTKEELHNSLAKVYKQQATDFYKLLRPKYLRLKGLYETENAQADNNEKIHNAQETEKVVYHDVLSVKLGELLSGKCDENEQQLYIRMVKEFKKEKGCEIYNTIKPEYVSLHKLATEINE